MSPPIHPSRRRGAGACRRPPRLLAAMIATLAFTPTATPAQTVTWTGAGSNGAWDNLSGNPPLFRNWSNFTLPLPASTVVFGSSFTSGNPFLNASRSVNALGIDTSASFVLSGAPGQTLTLSSGNITRSASSSNVQVIAADLALPSSGTFALNGSGGLALNGRLSGNGGFDKTGAAALIIGAGASDAVANTFAGQTVVSAGTLLLNKAQGTNAVPSDLVLNPAGTVRLSRPDQIDDAAEIIFKGGLLDLNNAAESTGSLVGTSGSIHFGPAGSNSTALIVNQTDSATLALSFSGTGTFRKEGPAPLTLTAPPSPNTLAALHTAGNGLAPTGPLTLSGGSYTLTSTGTSLSVDGNCTVALTDGIAFDASAGTVAAADGGSTLLISGPSTVVALPSQALAGEHLRGAITIDAATVTASNAIGAGLQTGSSGTLTIRNGAHVSSASLFVAGRTNSTGTATITGPGTTVTLANYLGIAGANHNQRGGSGSLTLADGATLSTPHTYFFSSSATLTIDRANLTTGLFTELAPGTAGIRISDPVVPAASALTVNASSDSTFTGYIADHTSGPGSLTKTGPDTLTLTNPASSFSGPLYIDNGTVATPALANAFNPSPIGAGPSIRLGSPAGVGTLLYTGPATTIFSRSLIVTGAGGAFETASDVTLVASLSATAPFTKTGNGNLTLSTLNGTLVNLNDGSLRTASFTADTLVLSQDTLFTVPGGATATLNSLLTLNAGSTVAVELGALSTSRLSGTGTVALSDAAAGSPALRVGGDNSSWTFSGAITNHLPGTSGSLLKLGTGTVTLAGPNTYTGPTTVSAGTLVLNNSLLGPGAPVTLDPGATLQAQGLLQRPVTGAGTLAASGPLMVGDPASPSGFSFPGTLSTGSHPVFFLSAATAHLSGHISLASGAHLRSLSGLQLDTTASLAATGPFTIDGPLTFLSTLSTSRLTSSGPLTLSDNTLDLLSATLSLTDTPTPAIRQALLTGKITSSLADPTHSLAYLSTGTTTLIRLTLLGDANLDGVLNADDVALLDRGFATGGQFWWQGDFNYDGQVDQNDYLLIDRAYLLTKAQGWQSLGSSFLSTRAAQFGSAYATALLTSIPEPTCLPLLLPLLARRVRRLAE